MLGSRPHSPTAQSCPGPQFSKLGERTHTATLFHAVRPRHLCPWSLLVPAAPESGVCCQHSGEEWPQARKGSVETVVELGGKVVGITT